MADQSGFPIRANLVDKVVTYFAPQRGLARSVARLRLGLSGGYTGARTDRAALKEWNPRLDSADSAIIPDLQSLRARSRDIVRNNPVAESILGVTVTNAVGMGLHPVPMVDRDVLGLSEEQAAKWAEMAERVWWHWAANQRCDISGRQNHAAQQRTVLRSWLESGDVFAVRRFRKRKGDLFGLKVQLLEADRVSTPTGRWHEEQLCEGVEVDGDGCPVAYHVSRRHPGDAQLEASAWKRVPAFGKESGDPRVLHIFDAHRPEQSRGVPILAVGLERLKQMDRSTHAELMAQVVAGMIVYSITTPDGEGAHGALPSPVVGEISEEDAKSKSGGEMKVDYGAILGMAQGEELKMHSPNRPGVTWEPFQLHVAREVSASCGVPAGVVLHWFSKAYSASRGEWMLAWKAWHVRRDVIACEFSARCYAWLIEEAVARGILDAPGFFDDPVVREAWLGCEWRGSPPGQLDPLKEMRAMERRRVLGVSTLAQDTAEITGGDWRANLRQRSLETRYARELGLLDDSPDDDPVNDDLLEGDDA